MAITSSSKARAPESSNARSSDTNAMPPDTATACAHVSTAAGVIAVSSVRSMRQSGSFNHSRRCMKLRDERVDPRVQGRGLDVGVSGYRKRVVGSFPRRRHVGADAVAVDDAHHVAQRRAAAEQEGVVSRTATNGVIAGAHALGRCPGRVGPHAVEARREGEVELQVGEARTRRANGPPARGARARRAAWCPTRT